MKLHRKLAMGGLVAAMCLTAATVIAQGGGGGGGGGRGGRGGGGGFGGGGGGNFDPAQFQQRMMDNLRQQLGFESDADWNAVQPLIQRVTEARTALGNQGGGFGFGGRRRGGGGGRRGGLFGQPSPEAEALQQAIDNNAPAAQIKDLLTKYNASQKAKEEKLVKAQEDLRKVLTVKQEAQATLMGLVPVK